MTAKPTRRTIVAMVQIETDDARLFPENISVASAAEAAALRHAVLANLPNVTRLIMVLEEEAARIMCATHAIAAREAGAVIHRPPSDYIPPTRG